MLPASPRVVVLGASGIGRHHCNWWRLEGSMPSAVLGSSQESVEKTVAALRDYCGFEGKGYVCLDELLDQEQPDIVDVCLPPRMHYAAVKTALTGGCHVLCEKPFVYDDALPHDPLHEQVELCELAREAPPAGRLRSTSWLCGKMPPVWRAGRRGHDHRFRRTAGVADAESAACPSVDLGRFGAAHAGLRAGFERWQRARLGLAASAF